MKKVLLVSGTVLHYRVSVYNYMWRRFREHGWEFSVLTSRLQPQNLRPVRFALHEEPFRFARYRRLIEEARPDAVILFLHLKEPILWQLIHWLRLKRIPVVFWTKGGNLDEPDSRIRYHAFNYIFSRSDALIMYSADQMDRLKPANRAKAVPANNTLNFEEIPAVDASPDAIKAEFDLPFRKMVLFVGTMGIGGERKKVDHLVEVFRGINRDDIGAVIVGAGMPEVTRSRMNPCNTRYLGALHDPTDVQVNKLFKASDVFVVPGHIGLGLNQAFYWGLPVVTEAGLQPPEIRCLRSGVNGFLVPTDDIGQLRESIVRLLDDDVLRAAFSREARRVVQEEASTENMFQGFRRAVQLACERRGVPGPWAPALRPHPFAMPSHICVCICTYQRPALLRRLLESLRCQETHGEFTYSLVVTDNDEAQSGRAVIEELAPGFPVPIIYCTEPRRSIAHARNTGLAHATGDGIAFIDDDEFAPADWLATMRRALLRFNAAGILAPVRPHFDHTPPRWVIRGGFCERPEHPTGHRMRWKDCRTGNVLLKREILAGLDPVFAPAFGTGGSDVDFFRRMSEAGHVFLWCNEAAVKEVVPPTRTTRGYMLRRGLLRGGNAARHPKNRVSGFFKSVVAASLYSVALPFLLLVGQHRFMKLMISWCDHVGRIAGFFGLHLVRSRPM